ncbi:MAG TPA: EutN/CcmL family microcompartment protein [Bacteroidales bacterium]|nr:EutN/CcmL family microcompartment protein [Bacteroidales bacterium]
MILGKVIGNVVSTIMAPGYESKKIMIIQPVDGKGNVTGKSFLAIDTVQAGIGDTVFTIEEGTSGRILINEPESFTVKTVIAGIVDEINIIE